MDGIYFARCLQRSSQSITTPRILALSFGLTESPLTRYGISEDRFLFLVKCTIAVFSLSNWAPLRLPVQGLIDDRLNADAV